MGMYPAYKEIRESTLAALLSNPHDAAHVDGLLFVPADGDRVSWSIETCEADVVDASRFGRAELPFTDDERKTLGGLSLGKYPDWDEHLGFRHVLAAEDGDTLDEVLAILGAGENPDATAEALADLGLEPAELPNRSETGEADLMGFDTDLVCYGIPGYRTPGDLAAVWARIEDMLDGFPERVPAILDVVEAEVRYYYGCAARRSADLYLVW
ncbi:MAG: hypothetical protein JJ863_09340 [Deltaproteobacteria bacterium]|nr:hypothetical protein [Deltaproteobacteria bacterium]